MAFTDPKFNSNIRVLGNIFSNESAYQQPVLDIQTDATLDPGASPATGDRYILTDTGALNANFGTITGVGNNDIVEYDGSDFVIVWDASAQGSGAQTYDKNSSESYEYNGTAWATAGHPDGGDGITFNSGANRFDIDLADTAPGLELTAADGSGELQLSTQGNGIAGGSGSTLSVDPATEVAGSRAAVYVAADGVGINLDNSTLDHTSSTLQVKDLGITTGKIAADAIDNTKLADDAVQSENILTNAVGADALDYDSTQLRSGAVTATVANWTSSLTQVFTHSWANQDVQVEVYDTTTGETIMGFVTRAANTVTITLNQIPSNDLRVMLREINATETTISRADG